MKMYKIYPLNSVRFLFVLVSVAVISYQIQAKDLIKCKRENATTQTRQFCWVDDSLQEVRSSISLGQGYPGTAEEMEALISSGVINLLGRTQPVPMVLSSFIPRLKVIINWNSDNQCSRSNLWSHAIEFLALDQIRNVAKLGDVHVGYNDLSMNLPNHIQYRHNQGSHGQIDMSASFKIFDRNFLPSAPFPQERIPSKCTMEMSSVSIGYDPIKLNSDIQYITSLIAAKNELVIKSFVMNAMLLDQRHGALCSVLQLATTLRALEDLPEDDASFQALSFRSKQYVVEALERSAIEGWINAPEIEMDVGGRRRYWDYFVRIQRDLSARCIRGDGRRYLVSVNNFKHGEEITSPVGFSNANDYFRELENLKTLRGALWGLIVIGNFETKSLKESEWMLYPTVYERL
ncbi:MAG: hypothetical protein HQK53_07265 [Oligoflexia bacterium]|nr:hypothetical protein [Oligoflexia bacterium]